MLLNKWALLMLVSLLAACSATYQVVDGQGQVLTVRNPEFAPHSRVDLLVGAAVRPLQAKEIIRLEINPTEPVSHEGRVFYPARLLLKDSLALPDSASTPQSSVFLAVEGFLEAEHASAQVRIPLAEIRRLFLYEPKEAQPSSPPADSAAANR